MSATVETRAVFVLSSVQVGSGGFWWLGADADEAQAREAFAREVRAWSRADGTPTDPYRIRLVGVDVPATLDGDALTDWIDARLDVVEVTAPAIVEAMTPDYVEALADENGVSADEVRGWLHLDKHDGASAAEERASDEEAGA